MSASADSLPEHLAEVYSGPILLSDGVGLEPNQVAELQDKFGVTAKTRPARDCRKKKLPEWMRASALELTLHGDMVHMSEAYKKSKGALEAECHQEKLAHRG